MAMSRQKIKSFEELKHGVKIISPIDNVVTVFCIDKDGEKYLAGLNGLFPCFQFDANDFFIYDGNKENGEVDKEYFSV